MAISIYLIGFSAAQFHSRAAFSVRSEQGGSGVTQGFLGVLSSVSATGTANDLDLLNDYIRSQAIVEKVSQRIDINSMFSQRGKDWLFALPKDAAIEEVVDYWNRMVRVTNEARDGTLHVEVKAFDPQDAQLLVTAILQASGELINQLSNEARDDTIRLSKELVAEARQNVQQVLRELTDFRRRNKIVSPELELQSRSGVVNALQAQLAEALVARAQLMTSAEPTDTRLQNIANKIDALQGQIEAERITMSEADQATDVDIYGRYQSLLLEQEMMSAAYAQAIVNLATAHTEARRQARYMAVHIQPSLAETSLFPERFKIIAIAFIALCLTWLILMIFYRNARDKI